MAPDTWWRSLKSHEPVVRDQIYALHEVRPWWNLVCFLYPALWCIAIWFDVTFSSWWSKAMSVIVIGISIQAMAILMHEALHGNLFRNIRADRFAAFLFGIPAFFSGAAYRVAHLNHHRHTRTEKDQDEISYLCRTPGQYRLLFYAWFLIGTYLYFLIVPWKALSIAKTHDRNRILLEYIAMLAIYSVVFVWLLTIDQLQGLLWYWLIPAQLAIFLSNIRGLSEHLGTGMGGAVTRTRTIKSNELVSFLMLNLNYHLEHHLFPGIPWYSGGFLY